MKKISFTETGHQKVGKLTSSWSSFEEDAQSQTAEKLLQALKDVQHGEIASPVLPSRILLY